MKLTETRSEFSGSDLMTEQDHMVEKIKEARLRQVNQGRVVVRILLSVYLVGTFFTMFNKIYKGINFMDTFGTVCLRLLIAGALYKGINWVRYFFCIFGSIQILIEFSMIMELSTNFLNTDVSRGLLIIALSFMIFEIIFLITSIVTFIFHKGVKEFLYQQRNG